MKKILIIDNSQGVTGAFKAIFHVANSLKNDFEFHFALSANDQLAGSLRRNGLLHINVNFVEISKHWNLILYFPFLIINSYRLIRYIKKHSIAVVHVNDLYNMTGVVIKLFHPSVQLIYHVRLLPGSYAGALYRFWIGLIGKYSDKIIVVSDCVQREVIKYTKSKKIERIYDFFELEEKWPGSLRDDEVVKFLYPANFTRGKGHEYAIRSFRTAYAVNNSIRLTFAGSHFNKKRNRIFKDKLLEEASDLINEGCVLFTEAVTDIEKLIKEHDVLLNFSESESFSMTCYEASYYGIPSIVTDCGGPTEFISHEVTGLVVPRQDTVSMSHSIVKLASNRNKRIELGRQSRAFIKRRITEESALDHYRMIYELLFNGSAEVTIQSVN